MPKKSSGSGKYYSVEFCVFSLLTQLHLIMSEVPFDTVVAEEESIEDVRLSLGKAMAEHTGQVREITRRQDRALAAMSDQLLSLTNSVNRLSQSIGSSSGPINQDGVSSLKGVKVDLPRFSGEDLEGWIFQAEEYFNYHGVSDPARLQLASMYMTKAGLSWMRSQRCNNLLTTWTQFKLDLRDRFGTSPYEDCLEKLSRLQQKSSVNEYIGDFEHLLNEITGQPEEAIVTFFVGGLKPELKKQLKIVRPTTLRSAF